jgi:DNA-binding transcriptional regulator YhcF (GntR family)
VFKYNEVSEEPGESSLNDIYKNKPNKYLYECIVEGIAPGKKSILDVDKVPVIKPNEALPSFEELTVEYPPWLIRQIFKKLIRKGYVVERNGKLIVVDTEIAKKIKHNEYDSCYEYGMYVFATLFVFTLVALLFIWCFH